MREAVILKCMPETMFHLGEFAQDLSTSMYKTNSFIHSDTLFGAFVASLLKIYPEELDFFNNSFKNGEIAFSSAFYCVEPKDMPMIYLLPKPLTLNLFNVEETKKIKKIEFISKGIWEQGIVPDEWLDDEKCVVINGNSVFLKNELLENDINFLLNKPVDVQKVSLSTDEKKLYTQSNISISGSDNYNVCFYFVLYIDDKINADKIKILKNTIRLMNDNGIGGERSVGCGLISETIFKKDFNLEITQTSTQQALISLSIPQEKEIDSFLFYKIKIRGGMPYGKSNRLKLLHLAVEGSIIKESISASIVDLSENGKKYWKYGGNISLYIHKNFEHE